MSRDGSKTDIALTFSSKRGQWAFTLDSPRKKNSGNVSCYRIDIASVGGASVVVVAKLAPACSPPARVASKPGSRRRARSCGSARSVPRVDRASCRARVVLVSARVVVSSPVDRPPGGSVLANDVARARRRSAMLAKRDLFALLLSAFAVYYGTRSESFVTFDRAWYLPLDPGGNAPRYDDPATRHGVDNHPPPPLFVDLNGDGEYEIIAASASAPEIRVFAQPANNGGAPSDRAEAAPPTTSSPATPPDGRIPHHPPQPPQPPPSEPRARSPWRPSSPRTSASPRAAARSRSPPVISSPRATLRRPDRRERRWWSSPPKDGIVPLFQP